MKMNHHYGELKASYLFVDIAHKVAAYQEAHPEKEIIRLGIGDVTQPLAKCVVTAMQDAAAETQTPEQLETLARELAEYDIVIATEVGGGVVPMDAEERAGREAAGRLACLLAERADCVVQMFCGIPTVLKGELPQC